MSDRPIQVSRTNQADEVDPQFEARSLQPGALTGKGDDWKFTGDGVTTPAQVMGRIIDIEAKENKDIRPYAGNKLAAYHAAAENLRTDNTHLNQDPNKAVPMGEQFYATGGMSLKDVLGTLAKNIDKVRAMVDASSVGLGDGENKAIGTVRRNAASIRGLPTDPNI
jgi:hypothetical protein